VSTIHGILPLLLAAAVIVAGCTSAGSGGSGEAAPLSPSPTQTSYIIIETVPLTPEPLPATTVVIPTTAVPEPTVPPVDVLENGTRKQAYPYVIRSLSQFLYFTSYDGVVAYLREQYPDRPSGLSAASLNETLLQYTSDPVQETYLAGIADNIRDRSSLPQERVRIAVSLVQHIPAATSSAGLFPYEVLYYNRGSPAEKSALAASVLSRIGYGTALLVYPTEGHVALGLKCPAQYSVGGTGYCYVETAAPAIMTYRNGTFSGAGRMVSAPVVVPVSGGQSFDQAGEEYTDARDFDTVLRGASVNASGMVMDSISAEIYGDLRAKYGLYDLDITRIA
jgi:hypothetical protein